MRSSLDLQALSRYTATQLNAFFPLPESIAPEELEPIVAETLNRLDRCFQAIALPGYREASSGEATFNVLHTDQYCTYLLYLANLLWKRDEGSRRAARVYALNKALHGLNCVYDTALPDVFVVAHPVGSVIGKARLPEKFVIAQGCTIGAIGGLFPSLGAGLVLSAGAAVIGACNIGENVLVEPYTAVVKTSVPSNTRVGGVRGDYLYATNGKRALAYYFI